VVEALACVARSDVHGESDSSSERGAVVFESGAQNETGSDDGADEFEWGAELE